jgi:hypothetical protein
VSLPTPEVRAAEIVTAQWDVPGGPWYVRMWTPGGTSVAIGPYEKPANAQEDAAKIRAFVEAVIREARRG